MFPAPPTEAARQGGRFWSRPDWAWLGGVGVSAVIHVALAFGLGAIWVWTAETTPKELPEALLATTAEPSAEAELDSIRVTTLPTERVRSPEAAGGRMVGELIDTSQALTSPELSRPLSSRPPLQIGLPGGAEIAGHLTEDVGELAGAGGLGGNGTGDGDRDGDGDGDGFFGRRHPDGKSFVYVVDCSRSMGAPHRSRWKTRLGRVKFELVNSIGTLSPERSFFVIFFNAKSHPMPATGLLDATAENKERSLEWVARIPPAGDTDPRQALMLALRLQPDIIYFLTDGAFTADVSNALGHLKQQRSAIHTFAFGNRAGESTLKWIAKQNGGEYHYVP